MRPPAVLDAFLRPLGQVGGAKTLVNGNGRFLLFRNFPFPPNCTIAPTLGPEDQALIVEGATAVTAGASLSFSLILRDAQGRVWTPPAEYGDTSDLATLAGFEATVTGVLDLEGSTTTRSISNVTFGPSGRFVFSVVFDRASVVSYNRAGQLLVDPLVASHIANAPESATSYAVAVAVTMGPSRSHVGQSPARVYVRPGKPVAVNSKTSLNGLRFVAGEKGSFGLQLRDEFNNRLRSGGHAEDIVAILIGGGEEETPPTVVDNQDGSYQITMSTNRAAQHLCVLTLRGEIAASVSVTVQPAFISALHTSILDVKLGDDWRLTFVLQLKDGKLLKLSLPRIPPFKGEQPAVTRDVLSEDT